MAIPEIIVDICVFFTVSVADVICRELGISRINVNGLNAALIAVWLAWVLVVMF